MEGQTCFINRFKSTQLSRLIEMIVIIKDRRLSNFSPVTKKTPKVLRIFIQYEKRFGFILSRQLENMWEIREDTKQ
ncbi:hypothetical protein scyTo_0008950 [Scyliorhinus torazame]|uniref:Uncharacterized protein n=1 Tax=Scyliorhinus torazame TaxID=75743 RepID=A0A401PFD1_SCYTO|nr:hypothetical protein [Scyliorhinus torazame]